MKKKSVKLIFLISGFAAVILAFAFASNSLRKSDGTVSAQTIYISQEISKADFGKQQEISLKAEQDEDAPLKIVEAKANVIGKDQYRELTSQEASNEMVSLPKVVLQNVSDKTIVGITLMLSDQAAQTKRGFYIKNQSIKPDQTFTVFPENLVNSGNNPAKNPKFWLDVQDKAQISIRIVAFFEDGTMWANRDQRY